MRLTDEQIDSYMKLYKATFDKAISRQDALEQGLALVYLISIIAKNNENDNQYDRPTQVCK
jgi:hypothetical protein